MSSKKHFAGIFLSFFLNGFLFSQQEASFAFSIGTQWGIKTASIDELVFENDTNISKLVWNQECIPQLDIECTIKIYSFFLKTHYTTAVPIKSGFLEDFDYITPDKNRISHYSKHDLYVDKDFVIKVQANFELSVIKKQYTLYPYIGISYQNRKFSAQDGFLQYPLINGSEWTGDEKKDYITGTVISYEQAIWYPYFGIENVFTLHNFFLSLSFSYYPYVSIDTLDSHFLRLIQFYDSMKGGYGIHIESSLVFMPFQKQDTIGVRLNVQYEFLKSTGTTSSNTIGIKKHDFTQTHNVTSATKSTVYSFSFGLVFNPLF